MFRQPVFWMHEQSGRMKAIVKKFLAKTPLTRDELDIMRWYIFQYVDAMPYKPEDYHRIKEMSQAELRDYIVDTLLAYGIDPL